MPNIKTLNINGTPYSIKDENAQRASSVLTSIANQTSGEGFLKLNDGVASIDTNEYVDRTSDQRIKGIKIFEDRPRYGVYHVPEGYEELDYILTAGSSYINTNHKYCTNEKVIFTFQQTDTGSYRSWGTFNQSSYVGRNVSMTYSGTFCVRYETRTNGQSLVALPAIDTKKHTLIISSDGYVSFDSVNYGRSDGYAADFTFSYNAYLGTINPGGTTPSANLKGRIYYYAVLDSNDNYIQNMYPAKRTSDGVCGMYDVENDEFYTSITGTAFTAGSTFLPSEFIVGADLATVATSGNYSDLSGRPTIGNGKLTITAGSNSVSFYANQTSNASITITAADLGVSQAMKFIGISTTDPKASGATVSGHTTWAKGEVVIYKRSGESNYEEYINLDGNNNTTSWELLGDSDSYALNSVTVTGADGVTGGGDLTQNRTLKADLASYTKLTSSSAIENEVSGRVYSTQLDKDGHLATNVPWTDTLNTAGSSNSTSKLYLIGATSQTDGSQTFSSDDVYVTDTVLTAPEVDVTKIKAPSTSGGSTLGYGTSGQVLKSNGTSTYWGTDNAGVTSVATGTGLSGGTINTTGTVSLKTASSSEIGGVKVSSTAQTTDANAVTSTASRTYAVQLDSNSNAVVNVPWTSDADTVDGLHMTDQSLAYKYTTDITIGCVGSMTIDDTLTYNQIIALTNVPYGKVYQASDTGKYYRKKNTQTTASASNWNEVTNEINASLALDNQSTSENAIYVRVNTGKAYYSGLVRFFVSAGYDNISGTTQIVGFCRKQNQFEFTSCTYNGNNLIGIYQESGNTDKYVFKFTKFRSSYGADKNFNVHPIFYFNEGDGTPSATFIGVDHDDYATVSAYNYVSVPDYGIKGTAIQWTLLPYENGTQELGSNSYRWKNLYLSDNIIKAGYTLTLPSKTGTVALTSDIPTAPSTATSSTAGLVKLGSDTTQTVAATAVSSTASRTYAIQTNSSGQMVVNVPWTDTTNFVDLTSDQTIGGEKTFTTIPLVDITRLPATYQEIEYAIFNGTNYVDSGIKLTSTAKYKIKFTINDSTSAYGLIGIMPTGQSAKYHYVVKNSNASNLTWYYRNNGVAYTGCNWSPNTIYTVEVDGNKLYFNGTLAITQTAATFTDETNAYVGNRNSGTTNGLNGRLYEFTITNSGTDYDFVPCYRVSDNVLGYYEMTTEAFFPVYDYSASGTTTYTEGTNGGPKVLPTQLLTGNDISLQAVTDVGNSTTNSISTSGDLIVKGSTGSSTTSSQIQFRSATDNTKTGYFTSNTSNQFIIGLGNSSYFNFNTGSLRPVSGISTLDLGESGTPFRSLYLSTNLNIGGNVVKGGKTYTIPSKSSNDTFAMLSDIPSATAATSSTLGSIKLGSDTQQTTAANAVTSTASRTYAVQLNSSNQAVVNVPWENTSVLQEPLSSSTSGEYPLITKPNPSSSSMTASVSFSSGFTINPYLNKLTTTNGTISAADLIATTSIKTPAVYAPTTSGGSTYGLGTSGQILTSNGSGAYWADASGGSASVATVLISANDWENRSCTKTVSGILADETKQIITVTPANASIENYRSCCVYCSAQAANSLTFNCSITPTTALVVYIAIQECEAESSRVIQGGDTILINQAYSASLSSGKLTIQ